MAWNTLSGVLLSTAERIVVVTAFDNQASDKRHAEPYRCGDACRWSWTRSGALVPLHSIHFSSLTSWLFFFSAYPKPFQLTIVAQVISIQSQVTNVVYWLDDGTGRVEARRWVDSSSDGGSSAHDGFTYVDCLSSVTCFFIFFHSTFATISPKTQLLDHIAGKGHTSGLQAL